MSKPGPKPGYMTPDTKRILPTVRRMREAGATYEAIGKVVGRAKGRVYQICKKYEIGPPPRRRRGEGKVAMWRSLPPIDPAKAREITERNRAYWTCVDPSLRRRAS